MEQIGRYLLQIVAAAILCGIVGSLCNGSALDSLIRLVLAAVILLAVTKPIRSLRFSDIDLDFDTIAARGEQIIAQGEKSAKNAMSEIISEKVNAYVETKAACWGADIRVQTAVKNGIPNTITIAGEVSPYVRTQLTSWIEAEIGVKGEALDWN